MASGRDGDGDAALHGAGIAVSFVSLAAAAWGDGAASGGEGEIKPHLK